MFVYICLSSNGDLMVVLGELISRMKFGTRNFRSRIEIKAPDDSITFSMTPILLDSDDLDSENESFSVSFPKSKEQHLFVCDTRKIISWFGKEEAKRILYVTTDTMRFSFATVVTRCVVNNVDIIEDRATGELIFKSNISGFSNCVADISFCGEVLAEKVPITTAGIRLRVPFRTGYYTIIYYEWDDEEDDFGIRIIENSMSKMSHIVIDLI